MSGQPQNRLCGLGICKCRLGYNSCMPPQTLVRVSTIYETPPEHGKAAELRLRMLAWWICVRGPLNVNSAARPMRSALRRCRHLSDLTVACWRRPVSTSSHKTTEPGRAEMLGRVPGPGLSMAGHQWSVPLHGRGASSCKGGNCREPVRTIWKPTMSSVTEAS